MTEVLFILTTIFVAYVVYTVRGEQQATTKPRVSAENPEVQVAALKSTIENKKPATIKSVAAKTPAPKVVLTAKPKATVATVKNAGLKNPITGDVATVYSNYRFTKRWIKDALVAEGLLEKVYPNNELNAETDAKIKAAIAMLEAMDKYSVTLNSI